MGSSFRSTKGVIFVALMSSLGNVLSFLSIKVSPLVPPIPLGFISVSMAFDLSHTTTFISSLFGGPILGGLTGLIGGLVAAYEFGFSQGNLITGFGLPVGKALTGLTAGLIMSRLNPLRGNRLKMIAATVCAYIPEGLFTAVLFIFILQPLFHIPPIVVYPLTAQILVKAFIEMVVMGLILAALLGNRGFSEYVRGFFT